MFFIKLYTKTMYSSVVASEHLTTHMNSIIDRELTTNLFLQYPSRNWILIDCNSYCTAKLIYRIIGARTNKNNSFTSVNFKS